MKMKLVVMGFLVFTMLLTTVMSAVAVCLPPAGPCTLGTQTCRTTAGGACVDTCTSSGWVTSQCRSNQCNAAGSACTPMFENTMDAAASVACEGLVTAII